MTDDEFSKLHAEYTPRMLAFMRSKPEWCGHAHLFDDAVQCAWCAFLKLPEERQAKVSANFLITLAKNKLIDLIRHSEANHRMHEELLDQANHEPATWDQIPIESIGVDKAKAEMVSKFMPLLKPRERVAVELLSQGLESLQIAEKMRISRQAVDQLLARGIKKLRDEVSGCAPSRKSNNSTGYKGVSFHKPSGTFRARMGIDGKTVTIGNFATAGQANAAYCEAEKKRRASLLQNA